MPSGEPAGARARVVSAGCVCVRVCVCVCVCVRPPPSLESTERGGQAKARMSVRRPVCVVARHIVLSVGALADRLPGSTRLSQVLAV